MMKLRAAGALLCAAFFAVSAVGCGGDAAVDRQGADQNLRHVSLPPLPAGEPDFDAFHALVETVPVERIVSDASAVFVGTVVDKGGSEVVAPESEDSGPAVTVHRIRFDVNRVFRGARIDTIDITALDASELDPFEIGARYVVFAEPRVFGTETQSRLAAVGYWQGAFKVGKDAGRPDTAVNRRGDEVNANDPLRRP